MQIVAGFLILAGAGITAATGWRYGMTRGRNVHVISLHLLAFVLICVGGVISTRS